jgi:hypothetical protein
MALKKSELYASLWESCDQLRGGMGASQYKDYILVLLFIKYVSDKYANQPYAPITIPKSLSGNIVRPCLTGEPLVESTPEAETRGLFGFGIPSAWPGDGSG